MDSLPETTLPIVLNAGTIIEGDSKFKWFTICGNTL